MEQTTNEVGCEGADLTPTDEVAAAEQCRIALEIRLKREVIDETWREERGDETAERRE